MHSPTTKLRLTPFALGLLVFGCNSASSNSSLGDDPVGTVESGNEETHESTGDTTYSEDDVVDITLSGAAIAVEDSGADQVSVSGNVATIVASGTYRVTGTLSDGQLLVNAPDGGLVQIILNGANITSLSGAPIFVQEAGKTILILADGTVNVLADQDGYVLADGEDEPNAPLFSKDDLSIYGGAEGTGTLTVYANYKDGIVSKDGLVIANARITVVSENDDGIRGKDYLVIRDSVIDIDADGDALRSTNDGDDALGYIEIDGGTYNLTAGADGIQAVTDVVIKRGDFRITTGGGAGAALGSSDSAKALKAGVYLVVSGGTFLIDAADDALHSNVALAVTGGDFALSTGDDALHAEAELTVQDGFVDIATCYEGLEAASITVAGGDVRIVSSDDALNVAAGEDSSGGTIAAQSLDIEGGYIYANASGDGLDSNGAIVMSGGTVIVDGPTAQNNGAIDYDRTFEMSGGFLVAAGSSGMAEAPSTSSGQASLKITYGTSSGGGGRPGGGSSGATMAAGTLIRIESSDGTELLTFAPKKAWQSVVFSAPSLTDGLTGKILTGGTATGESVDGLYSDATYSGGTERTSFTVSTVVNQVSFQ